MQIFVIFEMNRTSCMKKTYLVIYFLCALGYAQSFNPGDLAKEHFRPGSPTIANGNGNKEIIDSYAAYSGVEKFKVAVYDMLRNVNNGLKEIESFKIRNDQSRLQKAKSVIATGQIEFEQVAFLYKNNFKLYDQSFPKDYRFVVAGKDYFKP